MSVPRRRKLTLAIRDIIQDKVGCTAGIGTAPVDNNGNQAELPYVSIYPLDSVLFSGPPMCAPQEDVRFDYQINSYGKRYDQAEWLADLIRELFIQRDANGDLVNRLVFEDHKVIDQEIVGSGGKLDNVGQIWMVKEIFGFYVTSHT